MEVTSNMIEIGTDEETWMEVDAAHTIDSTIGKWLFYTLRDGTIGLASPSQWRVRQCWRLDNQTLDAFSSVPSRPATVRVN